MIKLKLPSRYIVRGYRQLGELAVALVELPDNKVTPWATYRVDPESGACFHGHYIHDNCDGGDEAHLEFQARCESVGV